MSLAPTHRLAPVPGAGGWLGPTCNSLSPAQGRSACPLTRRSAGTRPLGLMRNHAEPLARRPAAAVVPASRRGCGEQDQESARPWGQRGKGRRRNDHKALASKLFPPWPRPADQVEALGGQKLHANGPERQVAQAQQFGNRHGLRAGQAGRGTGPQRLGRAPGRRGGKPFREPPSVSKPWWRVRHGGGEKRSAKAEDHLAWRPPRLRGADPFADQKAIGQLQGSQRGAVGAEFRAVGP